MRKREENRVVGPYKERAGWRVVVITNGRRRNHFALSEADGHRLKKKLQRALSRARPTVRDVMEEWLAHKVRAGRCLPQTAKDQRVRLRELLGPWLDVEVADVPTEKAGALYERFAETPVSTGRPPTAATHRNALGLARGLFDWATARGYLRRNPFTSVTPLGRPQRGKLQLRIDEARAFVAAALAYAEARGDGLAVGAVAALLLGMRATEIVHCRVRDLDDGGRVLWIDAGKTRNARRRLAVPELLRPALLRLAESREPLAFLFGEVRPGQPRRRTALWLLVRRICGHARVPVVTTHSLRGLFATLAVESGAVTHAVAAALGHASFQITAKHYAQEAAIDGAKTAAALGALGLEREVPRPN